MKKKNLINKIIEWGPWENIAHVIVVLLFFYVSYLIVVNPIERTVTNWILLLIALAVSVQIHQNINVRKMMTGRSHKSN